MNVENNSFQIQLHSFLSSTLVMITNDLYTCLTALDGVIIGNNCS